MARTLQRMKGRSSSWNFVKLPVHIIESPEFAKLSTKAIKALLCLYCQYRGTNNGDFTAAFSVMRKRGWKSKDTLNNALNELQDHGWVIKTRQGHTNKCSLYAVTWLPINECGGKLDVLPTKVASNAWRKNNLLVRALGDIAPVVVPIGSMKKGGLAR